MRSGRRPWYYLGGLALLLLGGVGAATLVERDTPAASSATPPVSWRSSGPSATATAPAAATPTPPAPTPKPRYVFPVVGTVSYAHTHHDYPASDIIAGCGSTVRAATDGVVLEVSRVDAYDPHTDEGSQRGGLFVSLLGDDGVRYYGSHLRSVAKGIDAGVRVRAGQTLAEVGDSGDAGVCHLHFGISPLCARTGDWWLRRGTIWPWSFLDSWRRGGAASPVAAIAAWHREHGCPPLSAVADR